MSFILDALKKSENDRQQQVPAEFSTVPENPDSAPVPRWLWVLGALLAVNLIVVAALVLRGNAAPTEATQSLPASPIPAVVTEVSPTGTADTTPAQKFEDRLEEARRQLPDRAVAEPTIGATTATSGDTAVAAAQKSATSQSASNLALLPSATELRLNGELQLPDFHIDLHVFNDNPANRFVFINTNKYRQGDRMTEGPVVEQITRDGVVLDFRGRRFMLPRE